jgi:hypothetical protein
MHVKNKRVSVTRRESQYDVGKYWYHPDLQHHLKYLISPRFLFRCVRLHLYKVRMPPKRKAMAETDGNKLVSKTSRNAKASKTSTKSSAPTRKPPAKTKAQTVKYSNASTVRHLCPLPAPSPAEKLANICPPLVAVQQAQVCKSAMAQLPRLHRRQESRSSEGEPAS